MDNTTAIAYLNHMGGTRSQSLPQYALQLWQWCLQRGITISAEHLPGVKNVKSPELFTHRQSGWMLYPVLCQWIIQIMGPCRVDLFATRLNSQLLHYIRPLCSGHGCLSDSVAKPERICIPSFLPGGKVPTKNQDGEKFDSSNSATVANSTLVPSVAGIPGGYSNAIATGSESPQRPLQSEASNDGAGYSAACCLESVG